MKALKLSMRRTSMTYRHAKSSLLRVASFTDRNAYGSDMVVRLGMSTYHTPALLPLSMITFSTH